MGTEFAYSNRVSALAVEDPDQSNCPSSKLIVLDRLDWRTNTMLIWSLHLNNELRQHCCVFCCEAESINSVCNSVFTKVPQRCYMFAVIRPCLWQRWYHPHHLKYRVCLIKRDTRYVQGAACLRAYGLYIWCCDYRVEWSIVSFSNPTMSSLTTCELSYIIL